MFTDIKVELSKFDWSGVSGLSDVIMVVLTLVLLAGLKQGSKSIRESSISRDADILRWAMSEMDALKPQIRLLTDAHKRHRYCGKAHDPQENQMAGQTKSLKQHRLLVSTYSASDTWRFIISSQEITS